MHVMGKVGVGLVAVAAICSTILTAKLIQVRNSWTKKSVTFQKTYRELQPKIVELSEQLARLEGDVFRSKELWGQHLNDVTTSIARPVEGILAIDRGSNHGLREKMTLYGFEIQQDGTSIYRGDFTVGAISDVQAQLRPNWPVRQDEIATWQQTGKWRWRNLIPGGYQPNFDIQIHAISRADDNLTNYKKKLATEVSLEKGAQEQLALRDAELVGGQQLSKDPAVDVEFREGLVAAIEQTEETRNQVLLKVDNLRRRLRNVQHNVDRLTTENIDLTKKLPQVQTTVSSTNQ